MNAESDRLSSTNTCCCTNEPSRDIIGGRGLGVEIVDSEKKSVVLVLMLVIVFVKVSQVRFRYQSISPSFLLASLLSKSSLLLGNFFSTCTILEQKVLLASHLSVLSFLQVVNKVSNTTENGSGNSVAGRIYNKTSVSAP